VARIEGGRRVVLHAELNAPGGALACNLGNDSEAEINTRSYAACGDHVAVYYNSSLFELGSNER
jgi:hypothetical protein